MERTPSAGLALSGSATLRKSEGELGKPPQTAVAPPGFEPGLPKKEDFKSPASAIPPRGPDLRVLCGKSRGSRCVQPADTCAA